jgi:hypothetical protein
VEVRRGAVALDGRSRLVRAVDLFDRERLERALKGPLREAGREQPTVTNGVRSE